MAQDWKDLLASLAAADDAAPAEPEITDVISPSNEEKRKGKLNILIDKKGRKGKVATIIEGFDLSDDEVAEIASELKRKIGTGGSSRGGEILLQGSWKDNAAELLKDMGFKVSK